jgi:hypothetical protein
MKLIFNGREVDPTNDFVFKYIFGNPSRRHLTLDLLNAVMRQAGRPEFTRLEILNPFRLSDFEGGPGHGAGHPRPGRQCP